MIRMMSINFDPFFLTFSHFGGFFYDLTNNRTQFVFFFLFFIVTEVSGVTSKQIQNFPNISRYYDMYSVQLFVCVCVCVYSGGLLCVMEKGGN